MQTKRERKRANENRKLFPLQSSTTRVKEHISRGQKQNSEGIKYTRQSASELLRYEAAKPRLQGFITALSQLPSNIQN